MRIWVKEFKNNRLLKDIVIEDTSGETRTHKVYKALDEACLAFDLTRPIWLKLNQNDFLLHAKTRFRQDNFVEPIDFDYLEFQVIEEDTTV